MPRGGCPSRTPTPSVGPSVSSTPKTDSSRFGLLREMLEEDGLWNSSDDSSDHSNYDFNYNSDKVTSLMLPIFASPGGKKKPKKKRGKGKAMTPAPKTTMSSGVSKTPTRQQMESEFFLENEEQTIEDMPVDVAEKIVGMAVIKVMEGHFAKLYSKIDNLKMEVSTLKTTVASLVEENKKLGEVRGNAPDPEKQPPATPMTPKKDLTIRPRPQLQPRKRVGTPLAREVLTRNWENQVEKDNATPMNIDESDAKPGRPGKAPRLTAPPPTLMHSRYAGASAMAKRREDDRGENDKGGRTRSLPNPRERQRRRRGRFEGSCDRMTELRNTITWRKEDNDRGGRRPGGRGGQQKRGESEAPEERKEKDERLRRSWVVTRYDDDRGVTEVYDCCGGRYESWRPPKG
jgi:hypothetical protein